jgi:SAM-dependent methyltransferase
MRRSAGPVLAALAAAAALLFTAACVKLPAVPQAGGASEATPPPQDAPYVETPDEVVREMLRLARVTPADVVYDLGSGDGRIVIAAARGFGARGVGVDIDPGLIRASRRSAERAGVADRVRFLEQDLFATDLREATVVTLYLSPTLNARLVPRLLAETRPGARVVSHDFDMGDWRPDVAVSHRSPHRTHRILLWTVPARVAGAWRGEARRPEGAPLSFELALRQRYQELEGTIRLDQAEVRLAETALAGSELRFTPARPPRATFVGTVEGEAASGTMQVEEGPSAGRWSWTARREGPR